MTASSAIPPAIFPASIPAGYDGWKKVRHSFFFLLCICHSALMRPQADENWAGEPTWDNITLPVSVAASPSGDIRLIGDSRSDRGNVQIRVNSEWRCICDDGADMKLAQVVCRQLGFVGARSYKTGGDNFGLNQGGKFWLDQVDCKGDESNVLDCRHDQVGKHNCGETECLGVICDIPRQLLQGIKLEGGTMPSEGNVLLNVGGTWLGICDDLWGVEEAAVACRQLGFLGMKEATMESAFGNVDNFALDKVTCIGSEEELIQCSSKPIMVHNCRPSEAAGVRCISNPTTTTGTTAPVETTTTITTSTASTTTSTATEMTSPLTTTSTVFSSESTTIDQEDDNKGGMALNSSTPALHPDLSNGEGDLEVGGTFDGAGVMNNPEVINGPGPNWQGQAGTVGGQSLPEQNGGQTWPGTDGGQTWPGQDGGQTWPGQDGGQTWPGQDGGQIWPSQDGGQTWPGEDQGQSWPGEDQGQSWPEQGDWPTYGSNDYGNYGGWQG